VGVDLDGTKVTVTRLRDGQLGESLMQPTERSSAEAQRLGDVHRRDRRGRGLVLAGESIAARRAPPRSVTRSWAST
jgi:hypothetical protein